MRICERESRERLVEMDFPGYAIGGLAVGEPREVTREMIALWLEMLPKDKPRYVMGVGYPDEIEEYARMGVDMMDCVLPTRAGRHGLVFLREDPGGSASAVVRLNIKRRSLRRIRGRSMQAARAGCRRYSRAYLRHLFSSGEPLGATLNSIHNLAFYLETMERVRERYRSTRRPLNFIAVWCSPADTFRHAVETVVAEIWLAPLIDDAVHCGCGDKGSKPGTGIVTGQVTCGGYAEAGAVRAGVVRLAFLPRSRRWARSMATDPNSIQAVHQGDDGRDEVDELCVESDGFRRKLCREGCDAGRLLRHGVGARLCRAA